MLYESEADGDVPSKMCDMNFESAEDQHIDFQRKEETSDDDDDEHDDDEKDDWKRGPPGPVRCRRRHVIVDVRGGSDEGRDLVDAQENETDEGG